MRIEGDVILDGGCRVMRRSVGPSHVSQCREGRDDGIVSRVALPGSGRDFAGLVKEFHRDLHAREVDDRRTVALDQFQCRVALAKDCAPARTTHVPVAGRTAMSFAIAILLQGPT